MLKHLEQIATKTIDTGTPGSVDDLSKRHEVERITVETLPEAKNLWYSLNLLKGKLGNVDENVSPTAPTAPTKVPTLLNVQASKFDHIDKYNGAASRKLSGKETKEPKFIIWAEWNDADVNAEKWTDTPETQVKGDKGGGGKQDAAKKEDKKGKSPTAHAYFDDPYGKIEMPPSLRVEAWKRPADFVNNDKDAAKKEDKKGKSPTVAHAYFDDPDGKIEMPPSLRGEAWKSPANFVNNDKDPVIVDTDHLINGFDLISNNEHLHESEFMRYCISQIIALSDMCSVVLPPDIDLANLAPGEDPAHTWKPWEHIYAFNKAGKGLDLPRYNSYGKYVVRLYWMGCWRKIIVDDQIPFDDQGRVLLPCTTNTHELWPMLLTKALIKVACLDYAGGNPSQEFGDMSVMQALTGWIPEAIPLLPSHMPEVWQLMKTALPEWTLPEQEWEKPVPPPEDPAKESVASEAPKELEKEGTKTDLKEAKAGDKGKDKGKDDKGKDKGKDDKKDKKDKDKDKDKGKEKSSMDDFVLPEKPELVVFATYSSTPKFPCKVSVLGEMAQASEKLRQNGLSHLYPHPVCITQTRSCPMEPPPPPVVIPAWKLIRPRKRKSTPHDEPQAEPEPPKPIQCIEITSAFVNYKVSPVPIPTDTHRPKSSLERGGSRSRASDAGPIEETDENAPSPPPFTPEPESLPAEETPKEEDTKEKPMSAKRRGTSAAKRNSAKSKRPQSRQSVSDDGKGGKESKELPPPGGLASNSGGLAPPPPALGPDGEPVHVEEEAPPEPPQDNTPKPKKAWMDFEAFCKCFRYGTLYVFHKTNTYLCNQYYSDLKGHQASVTSSATNVAGKDNKKPAPTNAGNKNASNIGDALGGPNLNSYFTAPSDGSPFYLFVDNLASTEIVVSYSVLARWFDPPAAPIEEKKSLSQIKQGKEKDLEKEPTNASISLESVVGEQKPPPPVTAGTLVAEPHSWKSLVTGQPILRLRTTGTKSAVLSLPPGRHVLKFMMTSPLGHHVHMCSTVNFVFGDEETVMPQLTDESCRFRDTAVQIIANLGKVILAFKDPEMIREAMTQLMLSHCPYMDDKQMSKQHHFQIFNEALYSMLKKVVKDIVTPDLAFAWRSFTFDATSRNILALPTGSRPGSQNAQRESLELPKATGSASVRGSAKPSSKKQLQIPQETGHNGSKQVLEKSSNQVSNQGGNTSSISVSDSQAVDLGEAEKPENPWANRKRASTTFKPEASIEEQIAAVKLQRVWRGYFVRKIVQGRTPGSDENGKVAENLTKCWGMIESNAEENGLVLLREMFKRDPDIMALYPFHKDEWNKIVYDDYKDIFPEQPSMNWFIVFRDIFYVEEEMLCVPRLYVPIPTCMLRVVDNDTGKELPRVFQRVAPYVYKKNKKGYSFVAEARTVEQPIASGNWRMRLIGSLHRLPAPANGKVCCTFATKEMRDYYVPNPKNVIFRQSVKVTEDHFVSLQVNVSKPDVYIKLTVLDNEEEVMSAVGKGHVVIPAFTFLKDITQDDLEARRSSSRALTEGGDIEAHDINNGNRPDSRFKKQGIDKNSSQMSKSRSEENTIVQDMSAKSRNSVRGATRAATATKADKSKSKLKRTESAVSNEQAPPSLNSMRSEAELAERLEDSRPHKYVVQATVMKDSWPLSESSWKFVHMLKEMEKNELKIGPKEESVGNSIASNATMFGVKQPPIQITTASVSLEDMSNKERTPSPPKEKENDPKGAGSKTKQQFDITKPNWTLRVVSDAIAAEEIEVKKDTERADEIRAMKKAWEDAEPGRAAKALQARLKYINSHTIKLASDDDADARASDAGLPEGEPEHPQTPVSFGDNLEVEGALTLEPPTGPPPRELLEPVDITPFIRRTLAEPRYLDEAEMQNLLEKRKQEIAEYKAFREGVEKWREADRKDRNNTKIQQLEQCQALQNALDAARERVNIPREAIRQRFLDAEQKRLDDMANQEAQKADLEAKSPKGREKSAGKKKGK